MHAIILGGIFKDSVGRPLGPYRLRTSAAEHGFAVGVIDYAWFLDKNQLLEILAQLITKETLVLGLSTVWFDSPRFKQLGQGNEWFSAEFFDEFKQRWPHIEIVIGGTKPSLQLGSEQMAKYAKWWLIGFSDIGFVELLKHLRDRTNFIYTPNTLGGINIKTTDCNIFYKVENMDDLETVFVKEDGFLSHQPISLEVSRGCIFKCSFCSHPFLGKKSSEYIRSAESIARELKRNYELFGTSRYTITDDTFNDSMEKLDRVERAIELSGIPNFEFTSYIRAELIATKPEMIESLKRLNCRGAQIGIESLGKEARQAIGKGMDSERVMEALAKFKATTGAKLTTGMIVGLPGDTLDDCKSYSATLEKEKVFDDWIFSPLGLYYDKDMQGLSIFDKEPEKYGYTITSRGHENQGSYTSGWINKLGITEKDAVATARELNDHIRTVSRPGGFHVSSFWYHGFSNEDINTMMKNDRRYHRAVNSNAEQRKRTILDQFGL